MVSFVPALGKSIVRFGFGVRRQTNSTSTLRWASTQEVNVSFDDYFVCSGFDYLCALLGVVSRSCSHTVMDKGEVSFRRAEKDTTLRLRCSGHLHRE